MSPYHYSSPALDAELTYRREQLQQLSRSGRGTQRPRIRLRRRSR
ncbi:hypothetical protein [Blastococcus sp. TBT05-19]|nr:hypothetical protein [Blastococcus sp. TBT05-19]